MKGPNVREGFADKISILDITPILLHNQSLPIATDMDGDVVEKIFHDDFRKPEFIDSYEV